MTVSLVVRHSSAGLLLQGSQLLKRDFTRIFVLRSSLLTFYDAKGRQKFVFFRAISFFVESIFHGNPDANSCSSFFMQFIFHAAHFSCSSFFHAAYHVVEVSFSEFSCHSAGIVWLPLIMQVTV
jgi:hypothetical protein